MSSLKELTVKTQDQVISDLYAMEAELKKKHAAAATPKVPVITAAPPKWSDYVGQQRLKSRLRVLAVGARSRNEPIPPMLFLAKPGSGKTTMASMLAGEMGVPLNVITKPLSVAQLTARLCEQPEGMVLLDECHRLPIGTQHVVMQVAESRTLDTAWGTESFPKLSIVAATTNPQRLDEALRSRFSAGGGVMQWDDYTDEEMAQIVTTMAERLKVKFTAKDCAALGHAATGIPRNARRFVTAARDMAAADLDIDAMSVLIFCEVSKDGLSRGHLDYLRILKSMQGQAGLDTMEDRLAMPKSEVRLLERLLMERGFIARQASGRQLTKAGRKVLSND